MVSHHRPSQSQFTQPFPPSVTLIINQATVSDHRSLVIGLRPSQSQFKPPIPSSAKPITIQAIFLGHRSLVRHHQLSQSQFKPSFPPSAKPIIFQAAIAVIRHPSPLIGQRQPRVKPPSPSSVIDHPSPVINHRSSGKPTNHNLSHRFAHR